VSFGPHSFSDLDFADDVALQVQALGSREDVPSSITVLGQEVAMVEDFVYLGSPVHSSTQKLT